MPPDLRLALRQLTRAPGFTATIVLVLALGIGATTAIFSVIRAVLLEPFPYPRGNEILFVSSLRTNVENGQMSVTYPDFLDWQKASRTTVELVYAAGTEATLTGIPEPATLRNATVSAGAWRLLGMQPVLGRTFTAEEDQPNATPVAVLSHATWQNRFAGDPGILGRTLQLDGVAYTVIGVMPRNFKFWAGDVWTPVGLRAGTPILQSRLLRMDSWVVTLPKPGHTAQEVENELNVIARQLGQQYPETNRDTGVRVTRLAENTGSQLRDPLLILLAAVAGVLLIACANVANLLLARTTSRRREFSVRAALAPTLSDEARGTAGTRTGRVRSGLIVAEVALSLMLLVAAGLLLRNFERLQRVDLGFDRERLLVVPLALPESRYATSEQAMQFFAATVERLRSLPVVASVAHATNAPMMNGNGMPLVVEGATYNTMDDLRGVQFTFGTADYFRAQGIRVKQGRGFLPTDGASAQPVIILNETAVKQFLPEGNPLGKRVMLGIPENLLKPGVLPPELSRFQWATVVGVVESVRHFGPGNDPIPAVYAPVRQGWDFPLLHRNGFLLIRTTGEPLDAVPMVRDVLRAVDRDLPVERITTMDRTLQEAFRGTRFNVLLLGLFAATALALAAVGIYGVVAWNVTQRTREIGVRLALGADRADVLRLVIRQSMRVVGLGLLLGLAGSLATTRLLQSQLSNLSAFDPWTFAGVVVVLGASALLACWLPARRAARVDPMVALRTE
jgi:hypothetical protein